MATVHVESFHLNKVRIKTTVTDISKKKVVDDHISSFIRTLNKKRVKVIGFDIQFVPTTNRVNGTFDLQCAVLHLCDGFSCLIIHLTCRELFWESKSFPSLVNFLSSPDYTFVGVGIKDNLPKLKKYYGFGCRNAVELGPLAANFMKMPRLEFCGVDELAFVVNKLDLKKHRPLNMDFYWGFDSHNTELVKFVTVNVYSFYKIGSTLLGSETLTPNYPRFGWFRRRFFIYFFGLASVSCLIDCLKKMPRV
ncbi:uncharacterized protein [Cicer arietinum]|uniref:Uncharacterized protein At5g06450-like n=1 Tax=Cicer arietinum TaxID=3827 RepID=A0A3Q7XR21_CICAR|nr:uncharacterized protein At5g06450-like [Cicer arietinum]